MRRIHRLIGIISALVLLVISITGTALHLLHDESVIVAGEWRAVGGELTHFNRPIRLQYPGEVRAILLNPDRPNEVAITLDSGWWFHSDDGGHVWAAYPLPKAAPSTYDFMMQWHTGNFGAGWVRWLFAGTGLAVIGLIISGVWLYCWPWIRRFLAARKR